jgi:hypothetical protein
MTTLQQLRKALQTSIVTFTYVKKNGELREAKGTTDPEYISEQNYRPQGGYGPGEYGFNSYWDIDRCDWRCYHPSSVVEIKSIQPLEEEAEV